MEQGTTPGRNLLLAYGAVGVPALFALVLYPRLIANLGPERFGVLAALLSITAFIGSLDFGIGFAVTRHTARLDARRGGRVKIGRLVSNAQLTMLLIGALFGGSLIGAQSIWGLIGRPVDPQFQVELELSVIWLALSVPLSLVAGTTRAALEGIRLFSHANLLRTSMAMSTFALPVLVSYFTADISLICASIFVSRVLSGVAFYGVWRKKIGLWDSRTDARRTFLRHSSHLVRYGGWIMVGSTVGGLITTGVFDRFVIGRFADPSDLFAFVVPSDLIVRCLLIPAAIASLVMPLLARTMSSDRHAVYTLQARGLRLTAAHVGPVSMFIIAGTDTILELLTGTVPSPGTRQIMFGLATGLFWNSLAHVFFARLLAEGVPRAAALRHLLQFPAYSCASFVMVSKGHVAWLGWLWSLWALTDLGMLRVMVHRLPAQVPRQNTRWDPVLGCWIVALALVVAQQYLMASVVLNHLVMSTAAALLIYEIVRVMKSPDLLAKEVSNVNVAV